MTAAVAAAPKPHDPEAEGRRRMEFARHRAAQIWCQPGLGQKVMDVDLAEAFARVLVVEMYEPHLGCATTGELIEELKARSDLGYKTIGGGE